jgi:hypothetical protein
MERFSIRIERDHGAYRAAELVRKTHMAHHRVDCIDAGQLMALLRRERTKDRVFATAGAVKRPYSLVAYLYGPDGNVDRIATLHVDTPQLASDVPTPLTQWS